MALSTNLLSAFRALVDHVEETGSWVVVVAPRGGALTSAQKTLVCSRPPGSSMGGRTLLTASGGRLTVADVASEAAGSDFYVMPVGFEGKMLPSQVLCVEWWQDQAKGHVSWDGASSELRITEK